MLLGKIDPLKGLKTILREYPAQFYILDRPDNQRYFFDFNRAAIESEPFILRCREILHEEIGLHNELFEQWQVVFKRKEPFQHYEPEIPGNVLFAQ